MKKGGADTPKEKHKEEQCLVQERGGKWYRKMITNFLKLLRVACVVARSLHITSSLPMVMGRVAWAIAGAVVTSAILLNPSEESFRHQVEKESKKRTGFIGGKLAKFATYVMQESEILKFRSFYVCSVVTDETQPQRPAVVAVGVFGKWFFGDSFA